jgi:hypothetical protein
MTIKQRRKAEQFPTYEPDQHIVLKKSLLILLAAEPGELVGDHDVKLCSTLNDILALLCGDVVGNLRTVGPDCKK